MSEFKTIAGESVAEIVEKKSRFIAQLSHVETEQGALDFLKSVREKHAQARHNVYAYILSNGRTRYSDDGEPAQTSGMPTYEALSHARLSDVICVTTRYFGGTLLGTGGLVRAYTDACNAAIEAAEVVTISSCIDLALYVPYDLYEPVCRAVEGFGAKIVSSEFQESVRMVVRSLEQDSPSLESVLAETTRGRCEFDASAPFEGVF